MTTSTIVNSHLSTGRSGSHNGIDYTDTTANAAISIGPAAVSIRMACPCFGGEVLD